VAIPTTTVGGTETTVREAERDAAAAPTAIPYVRVDLFFVFFLVGAHSFQTSTNRQKNNIQRRGRRDPRQGGGGGGGGGGAWLLAKTKKLCRVTWVFYQSLGNTIEPRVSWLPGVVAKQNIQKAWVRMSGGGAGGGAGGAGTGGAGAVLGDLERAASFPKLKITQPSGLCPDLRPSRFHSRPRSSRWLCHAPASRT